MCFIGNDDLENLLQCLMLKIRNATLLQNLNYSDIFNADVQKQAEIGTIMEKSFRIREEILETEK